jgi:ABC-type transporter Mla subunit MlaD
VQKAENPQPHGLNAFQLSKERRRAQVVLESAEEKVSELESELAEIELKLSSPAPDDDLVLLASSHTQIGLDLEKAVELWEQAAEYVEGLGQSS